jgi:hypothetical protein
LAELGRWNPRGNADECPEYMTRASHKSRAQIEKEEAKSLIDIKDEPLDIEKPLDIIDDDFYD